MAVVRDELEQYLEDTDVPGCDKDILKWWRAREAKWPALAKMVKQYFSAPASSAGVERVFSAAGTINPGVFKHHPLSRDAQSLCCVSLQITRALHIILSCAGTGPVT